MDDDLSNWVTFDHKEEPISGTYSMVYQGILQNGSTPRRVAIKKIMVVSSNATTMRRKVFREGAVWSILRHPNILELLGTCHSPNFGQHGSFISLWCHGGDAVRFFAMYPDLHAAHRSTIWSGVLKGVNYLHNDQSVTPDGGKKPILVHGDLKPGNVLIDIVNGQPVAKLCDFGLVRVFLEEGGSGTTTTTAHTGTERYLSPELVSGDDTVFPEKPSDVYAAGCIGFEFIFGRKVYGHRLNNLRGALVDDILSDQRQPTETPANMDQNQQRLWTAIQACWAKDPNRRPSVEQVLNYAFPA